jgi:plastocyanin
MNLKIRSVRNARRGAARALAAVSARTALAAMTSVAAIAAIGATAAIGAVAVLCGVPLRAEDLAGHLTLLAKDGKSPARGSDVHLAVVYFEPAAPHPVKPPDTPFELLTRNKEFIPRVLAVPVGSRVQFPNQDAILHNVFSVSPGNAFDVGIYRTGPPKEKRFETPGVVRVYCNVHQQMVAYILVLDTTHIASPAADGSFRLTGLPKGAGKLTVWHEQADPWTTELTLPRADGAPPLAAKLLVIRPKFPSHLNKTGGAYARSDEYR